MSSKKINNMALKKNSLYCHHILTSLVCPILYGLEPWSQPLLACTQGKKSFDGISSCQCEASLEVCNVRYSCCPPEMPAPVLFQITSWGHWGGSNDLIPHWLPTNKQGQLCSEEHVTKPQPHLRTEGLNPGGKYDNFSPLLCIIFHMNCTICFVTHCRLLFPA